jgi:hypothetical protein
VEFRDQRRLRLLQSTAQHLGKQGVVAIPLPLVIEWNEKQVGMLQVLQQHLAIVPFSHGIAQWPTQAVQDAGLQHKVLDIFWLSLEVFFGQ